MNCPEKQIAVRDGQVYFSSYSVNGEHRQHSCLLGDAYTAIYDDGFLYIGYKQGVVIAYDSQLLHDAVNKAICQRSNPTLPEVANLLKCLLDYWLNTYDDSWLSEEDTASILAVLARLSEGKSQHVDLRQQRLAISTVKLA